MVFVFLSWFMLLFYGLELVKILYFEVFGKDCFDDDCFKDLMYLVIYFIVFFVFVIVCIVVIVIMYIFVFFEVFKWKYNFMSIIKVFGKFDNLIWMKIKLRIFF